ncbi:HK97 family phage prohead protease [bacterium]|nr:HK97 family phage prohead protease [bacterium]
MHLRRHSPFKYRYEGNRLSFYACLFDVETVINELDEQGRAVTYTEVIRPGAFTDSLADPSVEVVFDIEHDTEHPYAKRSDGSLLLQEDPRGLFVSTWLTDATVSARVESGELDGCSFLFVPRVNRTANGVVERVAVSLHDVCLTATPAYPQTHGTVHLRAKSNDTHVRYLLARYRLAKMK